MTTRSRAALALLLALVATPAFTTAQRRIAFNSSGHGLRTIRGDGTGVVSLAGGVNGAEAAWSPLGDPLRP
ncbi:MAG: hypothetical protein HN712_04000 [Gemmatimonadetes bacterium]|jgi:hypothetical protein|nr:hypothetical protein [Gemmatimonadota bacterium]MBT7859445.1 hypothetical protein [Gemmatimonadota bacterium]